MEKKVALYARVSTMRQEQDATIESQVAELESYAQEQGYEIDEELIFLDQAVSGRVWLGQHWTDCAMRPMRVELMCCCVSAQIV